MRCLSGCAHGGGLRLSRRPFCGFTDGRDAGHALVILPFSCIFVAVVQMVIFRDIARPVEKVQRDGCSRWRAAASVRWVAVKSR